EPTSSPNYCIACSNSERPTSSEAKPTTRKNTKNGYYGISTDELKSSDYSSRLVNHPQLRFLKRDADGVTPKAFGFVRGRPLLGRPATNDFLTNSKICEKVRLES